MNSFTVVVPKWLKLKETNSLDFFGGTLPSINQVENAIVINSIKKDQYSSLNDLKRFIAEDSTYTPGATPKWASDRTFIFIEQDLTVPKNYSSYKLSFKMKSGFVCVANFVILETRTAYLFIQFTATEETYNVNISKFKKFLDELKVHT